MLCWPISRDRRLANADVADPLTDPATLGKAVTSGILDAPHLRNNAFARGEIETGIDARGACVAIDPAMGTALPEQRRMDQILADQARAGSYYAVVSEMGRGTR